MKHEWKSKKKAKDDSFLELSLWITDKDKRATLIWISSFIGGAFIVLYYMLLGEGFTPSASFGQASLLLVRTSIIASMLVAVFAIGTFFPMFTYRTCNLDVDELKGAGRGKAIDSLVVRSVVAQALGASILFALVIYISSSNLNWDAWWLICGSLTVFVLCLICVTCLPTLSQLGYKESRPEYRKTIVAFAISSIVQLFFIFLMAYIGHGNLVPAWQIVVIWILVAMLGGVLSIFRKSDRLPVAYVVVMSLVCVTTFLGVSEWAIKSIAYSVGIAERDPVTLVVPQELCFRLQKALKNSRAIQCEGDEAGVVPNVLLRNSWGDRWNIRADEKSETIIFDGKGVVVRKDHLKKDKDQKSPAK